MKNYINPQHEFEWELSCITSELHKNIAIKALNKAPGYFWVAPASSSGKYHPKSSLGIGGLVRHTKAVFRIGEELLGHPLYAPFTDEEKDDIRVALLLHDAVKQGPSDTGGHTVPEHPSLVREHCRPWEYDDTIDNELVRTWDYICQLIETHMGIWNKDREGNTILGVPENSAQKFVHLCDYIASRKIVEVDTQPRNPQQPTKDSSSSAWRNDPAKDTQISYLSSLYLECSRRGIFIQPIPLRDAKGNLILTKGVASDKIAELKGLLGQ